MQLDYKSQYSKVEYIEESLLLIVTWYESTEYMTADEFKQELLSKIDLVIKYKPKIHLVNSQKFLFGITPELQDWVSENIFTQYAENGVLKLAFLVSESIISQISIEQSIQEDKTEAFTTCYFVNMQEAIDWLKK